MVVVVVVVAGIDEGNEKESVRERASDREGMKRHAREFERRAM